MTAPHIARLADALARYSDAAALASQRRRELEEAVADARRDHDATAEREGKTSSGLTRSARHSAATVFHSGD